MVRKVFVCSHSSSIILIFICCFVSVLATLLFSFNQSAIVRAFGEWARLSLDENLFFLKILEKYVSVPFLYYYVQLPQGCSSRSKESI